MYGFLTRGACLSLGNPHREMTSCIYTLHGQKRVTQHKNIILFSFFLIIRIKFQLSTDFSRGLFGSSMTLVKTSKRSYWRLNFFFFIQITTYDSVTSTNKKNYGGLRTCKKSFMENITEKGFKVLMVLRREFF